MTENVSNNQEQPPFFQGMMMDTLESMRGLINSISDPVFVKDANHCLVLVNDAECRFAGRAREEMIGKTDYDFFPKEQVDIFWQHDDIVLSTGQENVNEEMITDANGQVRTIVTKKTLFVDKSGKKFIVGIIREITYLKEIENKLREVTLHHEAVLDNIPDMAWLKDVQSRFIAVNKPFGRVCGWNPEDMVGKTDFDVWPRELAEKYRVDDKHVMESGERKCVEEPVNFPDGRIFWVETIKTPIRDTGGRVIGTAGIARDITSRKVMEEQLKNSREELEIRVKVRTAELAKSNDELHREIQNRKKIEAALRDSESVKAVVLNTVPQAIFLMRNRVIVYANEGARTIFGWQPEELMGKSVRLLYQSDEEYERIGRDSYPVMERLGHFMETVKCRRKDGKDIICGLNSATCKSWTEDKQIVVVYEDITEEREIKDKIQNVNRVFLNFVADPVTNINSLIKEAAQLLNADCAFYNCLEDNCFVSRGQWNAPVDLAPDANPRNHICTKVIERFPEGTVIIDNLDNSEYASIDPNIKKYGLKMYVGQLVQVAGVTRGVLCLLFTKEKEISESDKSLLAILASGITVEEKRRLVADELKETEGKLSLAFSRASVSMSISTVAEGLFIEVNDGFLDLLGHSRQEVIGKTSQELGMWVDLGQREELLNRLKQDSIVRNFETKIRSKDGLIHSCALWVSRLLLRETECLLIGMVDITARRQAEYDLSAREADLKAMNRELQNEIGERKRIEDIIKENERFLFSIFGSIQDGISVLDKNLNILQVNPTMEVWYKQGMPLLGKKCYEAYHGRNRPCDPEHCPTQLTLKDGIAHRDVVKEDHPDGTVAWIDLFSFPLIDQTTGQLRGAIEYVRNITSQKEGEDIREELNKELLKSNERLKKIALLDSLTGLYNYKFLEDVIEAEYHRARRYAHPLSLVMLDVDYFKSINDVYGYQFGDMVLKQIARLLKKMVRRYDLVIRSSGEEFIIVSPGIDQQQAILLGQRLLDAITLFNFGDKKHVIKVKLSIGVVSYPEDRINKGLDFINAADQILSKAKEAGGNRVYSSMDVRKRKDAGNTKAGKKVNVKHLEDKINKLTKRANQSLVEAIFAFAKTIEAKDHYTGSHGEQTVRFAIAIASALEVSKEEIELIRQAAILHDLGKVGVSEAILNKKGKLTKKEFDEIKKHPQIGADIIRPIQFLHEIVPYIFYHHEKWNGKGYPNGIKGEEIPLGARVIAIADAYQALTGDRPYRKAYSKKEAIEIIKKGAGIQFDPRIVSVFLKIIKDEK